MKIETKSFKEKSDMDYFINHTPNLEIVKIVTSSAQEPVLDWSGGRDPYFQEGQTYTQVTWHLYYKINKVIFPEPHSKIELLEQSFASIPMSDVAKEFLEFLSMLRAFDIDSDSLELNNDIINGDYEDKKYNAIRAYSTKGVHDALNLHVVIFVDKEDSNKALASMIAYDYVDKSTMFMNDVTVKISNFEVFDRLLTALVNRTETRLNS